MIPTSRNTTYNQGGPPLVQAADLNDLEDHLVNIHKALGFRNESFGTLMIREPFLNPMTVAAAQTSYLIPDTNWQADTSANAAVASVAPDATHPTPLVRITPGTANGNFSYIYSRQAWVHAAASFGVYVFEWDIKPNTSLANITWRLGLSQAPGISDTQDLITVRSIAGAAWQGLTSTGAPTATSLTDTPAVGTRQRIRFELHNAASAVGIADFAGAGVNTAKAIFKINNVIRAVVTATLPVETLYAFAAGECTGVASGTADFGQLILNATAYSGDTPMNGTTGL